jgi:hypothetical protein
LCDCCFRLILPLIGILGWGTTLPGLEFTCGYSPSRTLLTDRHAQASTRHEHRSGYRGGPKECRCQASADLETRTAVHLCCALLLRAFSVSKSQQVPSPCPSKPKPSRLRWDRIRVSWDGSAHVYGQWRALERLAVCPPAVPPCQLVKRVRASFQELSARFMPPDKMKRPERVSYNLSGKVQMFYRSPPQCQPRQTE